MTVLFHLLLFVVSSAVIWLLAGRLIEVVERLARRFRQSGFTVAFFILGFLTSISELSVMVNSTLTDAPQVSAGNLAGASLVLLLFLVPLLAILGNGIHLDNTLNQGQLALALIVTALPTLLLLGGSATLIDGVVCLLGYGLLLFLVRTRGSSRGVAIDDVDDVIEEAEDVIEEVIEEAGEIIEEVIEDLAEEPGRPVAEVFQIVVGAVLIFVAGNFLVEEAEYFSRLLNVPSSLIGLLVLSVGTNMPEIVIAVRSVRKGQTSIAFGNYIGSALTNVFLFGLLVLINGSFGVVRSEFVVTALLMAAGFSVFYLSARSQNRLSRLEGHLLIGFYVVFIALQAANLARTAVD
jgi:cation:H+ antiporter